MLRFRLKIPENKKGEKENTRHEKSKNRWVVINRSSEAEMVGHKDEKHLDWKVNQIRSISEVAEGS